MIPVAILGRKITTCIGTCHLSYTNPITVISYDRSCLCIQGMRTVRMLPERYIMVAVSILRGIPSRHGMVL